MGKYFIGTGKHLFAEEGRIEENQH